MRLSRTSPEEISEFAQLVQNAFLDNGVRLPENSYVMKYIRAAYKFSSANINGDNLDALENEEYWELIENVLECQRLGMAIKWARGKDKFSTYLPKLLKGSIDPTEKKRTDAKDSCFELKTLEMFEAAGIKADFVEPDVVFILDGREYAIACKCLYSLKNIEKQVRKAVRQIKCGDRKGLIALSIDQIVIVKELLNVVNEVEFNQRIEQTTASFVKKYDPLFAKWIRSKKVIGLLISLSTLTTLRTEHIYASAQYVVIQNRCSETSPYFSVLRTLEDTLFSRII